MPALDVPILGDCGFRGSGGGALSGSELSHLCFLVSRRHREAMRPYDRGLTEMSLEGTYMGIKALPWSEDAEC